MPEHYYLQVHPDKEASLWSLPPSVYLFFMRLRCMALARPLPPWKHTCNALGVKSERRQDTLANTLEENEILTFDCEDRPVLAPWTMPQFKEKETDTPFKPVKPSDTPEARRLRKQRQRNPELNLFTDHSDQAAPALQSQPNETHVTPLSRPPVTPIYNKAEENTKENNNTLPNVTPSEPNPVTPPSENVVVANNDSHNADNAALALQNEGITEAVAKEIASKYPLALILRQIKNLPHRQVPKSGTKQGQLLTSIKENWADTPEVLATQQKLRDALEQTRHRQTQNEQQKRLLADRQRLEEIYASLPAPEQQALREQAIAALPELLKKRLDSRATQDAILASILNQLAQRNPNHANLTS